MGDNVCDERGRNLIDDARLSANLSNGFIAAGVLSIAAGAVLWFTAPKAERPDRPRAARLQLLPTASPTEIGTTIRGTF
jgi:hypothetical protein